MLTIKNSFFFFSIITLILSRIIIQILEIELFGISYGFHLLDKTLLQYDLAKSIFYLHSQPLGWNLYIGLLTKIFNGNEKLINYFFEIYQVALTLIIIKFSILISQEININNNKIKIFLYLFLVFNPSILFWEKIFSYQHTICTLIVISSYFIIKLCRTKELKYETNLYLIIFLLSLIWSAFQPLLILFIFIFLRFLKIKTNKKNFFSFIVILFLSFLPFIKNKIVFNSFTVGSWAGHQLSTTFLDWKTTCDLPDPTKIYSEESIYNLRMYEKIYERKFSHPSLVGEKSKYNYVGIIYKSQKCLAETIKRILQNPREYMLGRLNAFLASHGKFAFDFAHPKPLGWDKYYQHLENIYKNPNYKLTRQALIFAYMISVYLFFIYLIFLSKENSELKKSYLIILTIYSYILVVSHLATGHEQSRMMYSGIIIHILFFLNIMRKLFYEKKN